MFVIPHQTPDISSQIRGWKLYIKTLEAWEVQFSENLKKLNLYRGLNLGNNWSQFIDRGKLWLVEKPPWLNLTWAW